MIIGEALGAIGGKKLGDALGLGDIGTTILGGIGGFLGSLLPFKEGGSNNNYIETELTPEEIEEYRKAGFTIEEIY